jgi:hypothetical protein
MTKRRELMRKKGRSFSIWTFDSTVDRPTRHGACGIGATKTSLSFSPESESS